GYEEARLVYHGLANTVVNDGSQRLVIDIGGGSTEFIIGVEDEPLSLDSLGMGCVTFAEKFFFDKGVNEKSLRRAYLAACSELEQIRRTFLHIGWDAAW